MHIKKKKLGQYFALFLVSSLILIILGYNLTPAPDIAHKPNSLGFGDSIYIFIINFSLFLSLIVFSFTGFSTLFIFRFIFSMGASGKESGIDPLIYYFSSFSHGIGELIVSYIILAFTYLQFRMFYLVLKKKKSTKDLGVFYKFTLFTIIPIGLILSIINALSEIYISNKLVRLILSFI